MAKRKGVELQLLKEDLKRFSRTLTRIGKRVARADGAVARALNQHHERIMTQAKKNAPVDTGVLRASGFVSPPRVFGSQIVSDGQFGGPAAPYALRQHEEHKTRSKYYERALLEGVRGMGEQISRAANLEVERAAR